MTEKCNKLEELMREQIQVIRRHIQKHKWYYHISDLEGGIKDFIEKYAWVMREVFCDRCPENPTCEPYQQYLLTNEEIER